MARNVRTYLGADAPTDESSRPKHLTKQEFGRRLYRMLQERGWSQSDLARRADVTRDAVSTYVRGMSAPEPKNLKKIATALGMTPEELLPNIIENAIDRDPPSIDLKVTSLNPDIAWLRVNRAVSTRTGLEIMTLLSNDKPETPD